MTESVPKISDKNWGHPLNWFFGAIVVGILAYVIWAGIRTDDKKSLRLIVYAFSTQEEVHHPGHFSCFRAGLGN